MMYGRLTICLYVRLPPGHLDSSQLPSRPPRSPLGLDFGNLVSIVRQSPSRFPLVPRLLVLLATSLIDAVFGPLLLLSSIFAECLPSYIPPSYIPMPLLQHPSNRPGQSIRPIHRRTRRESEDLHYFPARKLHLPID